MMRSKTHTDPAAHRSRLRILKVAAMSILTSTLLVACSSAAGGPNSLTLWYAPDNPGVKSQELWKQYNIAPFRKLYPNVKVNAVLVNGDTAPQKQKVALAAGNGPDIITTPGSSNAIPYATAGYLGNLNAAAKANNWTSRLLPWALDMGYVNGKLIALPTSYETLVLYYNKTLFQKYGWKVPTDRASLVDLAAKMEAKGITPFAAGNASYTGQTEWYVSLYLNQVAGPATLYKALSGKIPWTDPSIEASIQMMKDDFAKGWYGGGVKQYFSTQDPQKYSDFADGKAGMLMSGSWEMTTLGQYFDTKGNTNQWAWAPLPPLASGVPSGVFPLSVGGTISVNAHSKSVKPATNYISWLFSDTKNMWAAAKATGSEPLPIKYSPSDVPAGIDPRYASQYQAINDASESGLVGYTTWTSFGAKADAYILDNADKVINGNLSVDAFCQGIGTAFAADKAAGLIPPLFTTKG